MTGCGNTVDTTQPRRAAADPRLAALLGHRDARRRVPLRPRVGARPHRARRRHAQRVPHHDRPGPGAAAREADRRAVGRVAWTATCVGSFPPPWVEWNDRYRDTMRDFWRGATGRSATSPPGWPAPPTCTPTTAGRRTPRSTSSPPTTASRCATWSSYDHKHNEANGEDNRDGTDNNRSWNHGVEGETDDAGDRRAAAPAGRQPDGDAVPVQRVADDHRRRRARAAPSAATTTPTARTTRSRGSTGGPTTRGSTSTRSPRPRCGCGASTPRCASGTTSPARRRSTAAPRTSPGCTPRAAR